MSRKNHMIANRGSSRTRMIQIVAGVSVVALLAGIWITRSGSSPAPTESNKTVDIVAPGGQGAPSILASSADLKTQDLGIYLDGWTKRILGANTVEFTLSDGRSTVLNFQPLTKEQITAALNTAPEVIAAALSRMVDGDQRVSCNADGCTAGDRKIDPGVLADPSKIAGLGGSYAGWSIEHGLWRAEVTVPEASDRFLLSSKGYRRVEMLNPYNTIQTDEADQIIPASSSGWAKGQYLLGAGWGLLFSVDPYWVESAPAAGNGLRWIRRALGTVKTAPQLSIDALYQGPGDRSAAATNAANGLNDSQLTFLSSPTTGCGPAVLCTPSPVKSSKSEETTERAIVCEDGGQAVLTITNRKVTVSLPHPTHLAGAWAKNSSDLGGSTNLSSVLGFTGTPVTRKGTVIMYESLIQLVDDNGLLAVAGARDTTAVKPFTLAGLPDIFGGRLTRCG